MVEYVEYKGEKLPFRISQYAIGQFQKETKLGLDSLSNLDNEMFLMEPLFYYAIIAGHKFEGKELKYTRDELVFVLDDVWTDFISKMSNFFPKPSIESKETKENTETKENIEVKKN